MLPDMRPSRDCWVVKHTKRLLLEHALLLDAQNLLDAQLRRSKLAELYTSLGFTFSL